jgi:hypothetical protein
MTPARRIWQLIETVHAVTYFAAESAEAAKQAGLRGFWMGYFGFRAAPLGAVQPGVVEATFANFAPAMVRRAIPDAWDFADPAVLIIARSTAAAAALRRVASDVDDVASEVNTALESAISCASPLGRPLFAANAGLDPLGDPAQRLWQNCTTLREHRGDGHVAALASRRIDGCEAHLLIAAEHGWSPEVFFDNRGWSVDEQSAASERLRDRGLLDDSGLTLAGAALRHAVEELTDELAWDPYERAGSQFDMEGVAAALTRIASQVRASETVPFPNPMGLPHPEAS